MCHCVFPFKTHKHLDQQNATDDDQQKGVAQSLRGHVNQADSGMKTDRSQYVLHGWYSG